MLIPQPETEAAELVKLLPAQKQARFYRLAIWPDLFGGFSLAREYGRIGQSGRLQLDPYPEIEPARSSFARIFSDGSSAAAMSPASSGSGIEAAHNPCR
jgi:predicted DNA-binding WGR domain protein